MTLKNWLAIVLGVGLVGLAFLSWWQRREARTDSDKELPKHPNVVLIIIDTLRDDKLGSYGESHRVSPELDYYAEKGVRFPNVLAQCSWTRPSIGSMLTSLYPRTIGIYRERKQILNDRFRTMAEVFHEAGYRTLGATANPNINSSFNFDQGFDKYIDSNVVFRWMKKKDGQTVAWGKNRLHTAPHMFRQVSAWLDAEGKKKRIKPHFVQINVMEVHEAREDIIREEFRGLYGDRPRLERRYLQTIRQVSVDIQRFVQELQKRPGWKNTVFVFVSDHGEGLLDHPFVPKSDGHGRQLYASQTRVPWFLYSPVDYVPSGMEIERRVRLLELMPTVLDIANVKKPEGMQGESLAPLIRDQNVDIDIPERFVVETQFRRTNKVGVYTPRWKYYENRDRTKHVRPRALHRVGVTENGKRTDVGPDNPKVLQRMSEFLSSWERKHPRTAPTLRGKELSASEVEQLRSLGYVE